MTNKSNFVISTRNVFTRSGKKYFGSEPGATTYLEVPAHAELARPIYEVADRSVWLEKLLERAGAEGDILIFVHGYNNSIAEVMERHDLLQANLRAQGFEGAIVSFDWPSGQTTIGYLEDRDDALNTSLALVRDGIALLAQCQRDQYETGCEIDVHLLGHSTGAYVIREAFYKADKNKSLGRINWNVSQVALIGADISQKALSAGDSKSRSLFTHAMRITNYQNPFDSALKFSNVKRLGLSPRVGRVGVSDQDRESTVVNVDAGNYWEQHIDPLPDSAISGGKSHSWHFQDEHFARDLALTLKGDIDRHRIPTRETIAGKLHLRA